MSAEIIEWFHYTMWLVGIVVTFGGGSITVATFTLWAIAIEDPPWPLRVLYTVLAIITGAVAFTLVAISEGFFRCIRKE